jgi:hypothetical protein
MHHFLYISILFLPLSYSVSLKHQFKNLLQGIALTRTISAFDNSFYGLLKQDFVFETDIFPSIPYPEQTVSKNIAILRETIYNYHHRKISFDGVISFHQYGISYVESFETWLWKVSEGVLSYLELDLSLATKKLETWPQEISLIIPTAGGLDFFSVFEYSAKVFPPNSSYDFALIEAIVAFTFFQNFFTYMHPPELKKAFSYFFRYGKLKSGPSFQDKIRVSEPDLRNCITRIMNLLADETIITLLFSDNDPFFGRDYFNISAVFYLLRYYQLITRILLRDKPLKESYIEFMSLFLERIIDFSESSKAKRVFVDRRHTDIFFKFPVFPNKIFPVKSICFYGISNVPDFVVDISRMNGYYIEDAKGVSFIGLRPLKKGDFEKGSEECFEMLIYTSIPDLPKNTYLTNTIIRKANR